MEAVELGGRVAMEAGPRESNGTTGGVPERRAGDDAADAADAPEPRDPFDSADSLDSLGAVGGPETVEPARHPGTAGIAAGDPAAGEEVPEPAEEQYEDLRPPRRLRPTQLAPILALGLLGSLMFAFPLAFAFDEAGAVVAMLGLLIGCSAAGWGMMAARRVGYTWPGLPPPGSGRRPDWRVLALYAVGLALLATLAVWRVAALR